jgi:hypothetical protein
MDLEKSVRISLLNDFYGVLLTKKQKKIVEDYFNNNISLGEISQQLKISRQAVFDTLERANLKLEDYESKLKLLKKFQIQRDILSNSKKLCKEDLKKLLNVWEI